MVVVVVVVVVVALREEFIVDDVCTLCTCMEVTLFYEVKRRLPIFVVR